MIVKKRGNGDGVTGDVRLKEELPNARKSVRVNLEILACTSHQRLQPRQTRCAEGGMSARAGVTGD